MEKNSARKLHTAKTTTISITCQLPRRKWMLFFSRWKEVKNFFKVIEFSVNHTRTHTHIHTTNVNTHTHKQIYKNQNWRNKQINCAHLSQRQSSSPIRGRRKEENYQLKLNQLNNNNNNNLTFIWKKREKRIMLLGTLNKINWLEHYNFLTNLIVYYHSLI